MNTAVTPLPSDHPLMLAWSRYRTTHQYDQALRWLEHPEHREGQMWAAFMAGWHAGRDREVIVLDVTKLSRRDFERIRAQVLPGSQMRIVPDDWPGASRRSVFLFATALIAVAALTVWIGWILR